MKKPLVSVVIPLYNSESFISNCIESCLKQTYGNIEIIVVDDGSTDNGLDVVKKLAKECGNIKTIHTNNKGVSSARNLGIGKSNGEYVCFIDADDSIKESFVETMVHYLEEHDADFCFSKNICGEGEGKTGCKIISPSDAEVLLLSSEIKVGCWNKMYRKSILNNIRFRSDLFYGEGLYFINQIAHNSSRIVACEDALYDYRKVNPESATTTFKIGKMINGEKSLVEIWKFIKDDGRKVQNTWSQHYTLFCINAMRGILKNCSGEGYKVWRKKARKHLIKGLRAKGGVKLKARMILWSLMPTMMCRMGK